MRRHFLSTAAFVAPIVAFPLVLHADLPMTSTLNWYRGNTHTHTHNSDGSASPEEAVRLCKKKGYRIVVITDHEFLTDPAPLNALF